MPAGHLDKPFSPEERLACQRAYVRHQGLLRTLGRQLCQSYPQLGQDVIFSCIDVAFLKAFRVHDERKGKFSVILAAFARGGIRQYIRDHHEIVRIPRRQRELVEKARKMLDTGHTLQEVTTALRIDRTLLVQIFSLGNLRPVGRDDLTACDRATPMEALEAELDPVECSD